MEGTTGKVRRSKSLQSTGKEVGNADDEESDEIKEGDGYKERQYRDSVSLKVEDEKVFYQHTPHIS